MIVHAVDGPAVGTLTTAFAGVGPDMLAIAGVGIGIGLTIFALKRGYSLIRGLVAKDAK